MQGSICRIPVLAVTMLFAWCISAAAQDYTEREKLRAQSNEFRKEVIRVTDGVYVAVGYSASNVMIELGPENVVPKRIKAQALVELGERQINAIARNYYLSSAMYLLRDLPPQ
jgi:hypothetical protein